VVNKTPLTKKERYNVNMGKKFKVQIESDVADGTAPIIVESSTLVANLNSDLLDGQEGAYYSPINSPSFTGTPLAPTQTAGNSSTSVATTAFVSDAISGFSSGAAYQTTAPSSPSIGDIWVDSDEVLNTLNSNSFMQKTGGVFTGLVSGITPTENSNLTTKEYVDNSSSGFNPFFLAGI